MFSIEYFQGACMKWILLLSLVLTGQAFAEDLKLLSWNVFMLPSPIKHSLQSTRTREIARVLSEGGHDVIILEEAWTRAFREAVNEKVKAHYPYQHYQRDPILFPRIFGSGVYILSKYPFKVLDHVHFHSCATADCGAAKGSYVVELEMPGGKKVQLAGTHLQAEDKYGHIRMKQLKQIQGMLDKVEKQDVPQFLIGDLNIDVSHKEFTEGQKLLEMDHLQLEGDIHYSGAITNECYHTDGDGVNHNWIDHIWVRGMEARNLSMHVRPMTFDYQGKTCWLSDHHAMESIISL
jgi:endonuclease/exonuclease/phosphatase family metal-dependent hydrolase